MIFNTWVFALFACCTLATYWSFPSRLRPWVMIVASTIFYAYSLPAYLVLIGLLALVTYALGTALVAVRGRPRAQRALIVLGIVLIAGTLAFFKYSKLLASTIDAVAAHDLVPVPQIIVPLAISFFTFEFVHVLVDLYLGKIERLRPIEFLAFALFFPTLVAGPIKRYQSFAPQVFHTRLPEAATVRLNLYRVAIGLFKKAVIADSLTLFIAPLQNPDAIYGRGDYFAALAAFSVKVYFDFTGYSDMAIGMSGLLGFAIPENFDMPYRTANISEFWRHWHMSLSSWIRDYVFIPLGGSRRGSVFTIVNLTIAMGLCGLWHGANWTFVLWGIYNGILIAIHRSWSQLVVPRVALLARPSVTLRTLSVALNLTFVYLGWFLFNASSIDAAAHAFHATFF